MRAVIDTGILVQALILPTGSFGPILRHLRDDHYTLLFSNAWLDELVDILAVSTLRSKYHLEEGDAQALMALLMLRGEPVFPLHPVTGCPSPQENHLLEIAVTGNASALVTAGSRLLDRHFYQDIPIFTPAVFLELLG